MTETFRTLATAARAGAAAVPERPNDPYRSFLEETLEGAIANELPGQTAHAQQRRRFEVPGFEPYPYGVDIDWRYNGTHAGIEAKVWDVHHSSSTSSARHGDLPPAGSTKASAPSLHSPSTGPPAAASAP